MTPIANSDSGELDLDSLSAELNQPDDPHFARPALITIENTHNRCGGEAVAIAHMDAVAEVAKRFGLPVHLDGARIFNAALALETRARDIAARADSVSFCLSKGLAAPVGSLLCGSRAFVASARRLRKTIGGGMRQAGIIAAAGIVALETMVDRLAEDHRNAGALAAGLATIGPAIAVKPARRRTNMVFFEIDGADRAARFADRMRDQGVLISPRTPTAFRAVTHHGVDSADIENALAAASRAARETGCA